MNKSQEYYFNKAKKKCNGSTHVAQVFMVAMELAIEDMDKLKSELEEKEEKAFKAGREKSKETYLTDVQNIFYKDKYKTYQDWKKEQGNE